MDPGRHRGVYGESGSGKGFRHRWADKRLQRPPANLAINREIPGRR